MHVCVCWGLEQLSFLWSNYSPGKIQAREISDNVTLTSCALLAGSVNRVHVNS